jgi:flagellar protein FliO/FliZ
VRFQVLAQVVAQTESIPELGFGETLLKMFLSLALVVALCYLILNVGLRRLLQSRGMPIGRSSVVAVLERVPLDQRRALYVVKAAGEYLLLGGGEKDLSLLAKLDAVEIDRLQRERPSGLLTSPFLQKLLTRKGGPPPPSA